MNDTIKYALANTGKIFYFVHHFFFEIHLSQFVFVSILLSLFSNFFSSFCLYRFMTSMRLLETFTDVHRRVDLCMFLRVIWELGHVHLNRPSSQATVSLKQHERAGHRATTKKNLHVVERQC